jgi:F-type H+-transporting ATPase subunit delta
MPLSDTKPDALASLYATSLYELAEAAGGRETVERVISELETLLEFARDDSRFNEFLSSRVLKKGDRTRSLRAMLSGRVHDLTMRFLLVLNEKGRLGHLIPITAALDEIAQRAFGRIEVDVYTAHRADAGELASIKARLDASLGRETVVHAYTDPTMIGGVKMQIGDTLIDASLAARLRAVRDRLAGDGSARMRAAADRIIRRDQP